MEGQLARSSHGRESVHTLIPARPVALLDADGSSQLLCTFGYICLRIELCRVTAVISYIENDKFVFLLA